MNCFYCGSDQVKVSNSFNKGQSIQAFMNNGESNEEVTLSVNRRRLTCMNCHRAFYTVEHFEKDLTQFANCDITIFQNTPVIKSAITEEQKKEILETLREGAVVDEVESPKGYTPDEIEEIRKKRDELAKEYQFNSKQKERAEAGKAILKSVKNDTTAYYTPAEIEAIKRKREELKANGITEETY